MTSPEQPPLPDSRHEHNSFASAEEFLHAHGRLFAQDLAAWRTVEDCIGAFETLWSDYLALQKSTTTPKGRISHEEVEGNNFLLNIKLSQLRAYPRYKQAAREQVENVDAPDQEKIDVFAAHLEESRERYEAMVMDLLIKDSYSARKHNAPETLTLRHLTMDRIIAADLHVRFSQVLTSLDLAYMQAYLVSGVAMRRVQLYLEQEDDTESFIDAIEDLSHLRQAGVNPSSGLLELLGTAWKMHGAGFIQPAIEKWVAGIDHAPDFLQAILSSDRTESSGFKKDLVCTIGALSLAAELGWQSEESFIADYAAAQDRWPEQLSHRLEQFAGSRASAALLRFQEAILPFAKEGRIPTPHPGLSPNYNSRGRGKHARVKQRLTEIATPETTAKPITQFGFLRQTEQGYVLERIETIEELLQHPRFQRYIKKYSSDATIEPVLRAGLLQLCQDPCGPDTRRLAQLRYKLKDSNHPRFARRFSPQHFPQESKGPIATSTRLIYTLETVGGKPFLAIHGPIHKQAIHSSSLKTFPKLV